MSLNLNVWRGTDTTLRIQVFERNDTTPQTMTGWTLEFTVRNRADDSTADITKTTLSGIAISNADTSLGETTGANSVAVITIADDDTTNLAIDNYECDLKRMDSASEAILAFWRFNLLQEVTR